MRKLTLAALTAFGILSFTIPVSAQLAHAGGAISGSAAIGIPGGSISGAIPANINAGIGGPSSGVGTNGAGTLNASANNGRLGLSNAASADALLQGPDVVKSVGGGMLTLTTSSGQDVTLSMPPAEMQSLGLQVGTSVAVTRTSNGFQITNLDHVRQLLGRAVVSSVNLADDTVTFVNHTGAHTIAVARSVVNRLHLHRGSTIDVSAQGATQLTLTSVSDTKRR
jgi:hypothetical protein